MLQDTLRARPAENVACGGNLIEIAKGEDIHRYLGRIEQVTLHKFPWGKVGGNHWHKTKYEIMYVMKGKIDVYLFDPHKEDNFKTTVSEGKKFDLVPWVAHALNNPYEQEARLIEFANLAFDAKNPENDVYRLKRDLVTGELIR